ncbi:hypothetical protein ACTMNS_08935, partial [Staphylococcus haemolyticus]
FASLSTLGLCKTWCFNPKPNNLDRRFRIYRETLSRFSCAASENMLEILTVLSMIGVNYILMPMLNLIKLSNLMLQI